MANAQARRWRDLAASIDGRRTPFEIAGAMAGQYAPASVFDGLNQLATLALVGPGDGPVRWADLAAAPLVPLFDTVVRGVAPRMPPGCPVKLATAVPRPGRGWRGAAGSAGERVQACIAALGEAAERDALFWRGDRAMPDLAPARSAISGREVWLPAAACWRAHPDGSADSGGCASGATFEAAFVRGFLELVERDAIALWWLNRVQRAGIAVPSLGDALVAEVSEWLEGCGRSLHLLDLTSDLGVPVVGALSWNREGGRVGVGFGAHWSMAAACRRAVCEMVSAWTAAEASADAAEWLETVSIGRERYLVPAGESEGVDAAGAGSADAVRALAERHGLEVLALDMTTEETGIPVARVVVPGLATPWRPTARVREAPVRMGWRGQAELNPVRFFF